MSVTLSFQKDKDMKITKFFVLVLLFYFASANDAPGFFLKTTKNIPRLGKRVFIKQGSKNIPRLGRRSESQDIDDSKNYNHLQPFDSKFISDFLLQDEMLIGDGDLKFLSWDDLDKALESDSALKKKLTSIARDKEVEELRKFAYDMNLIEDDMYGIQGDRSKNNKIYQNFVPFETQKNLKYDNNENDFYYYYTNEVKKNDKHFKTNRFPKFFIN